jgi:hypothetical protein
MAKPLKKTISPRVNDNTRATLGLIFDSPTSGAAYLLESFPATLNRVLEYVLPLFSKEQIKEMIEKMEGVELVPSMPGDFIKSLAFSYGIVLELQQMTQVSRFYLEIWLQAYHQQQDFTLDQYIEEAHLGHHA